MINDAHFYVDKNQIIYTPWGAKYYPTVISNGNIVYKTKSDDTTIQFVDSQEYRLKDSDMVKHVPKKETKGTKLADVLSGFPAVVLL